MQGFGTRAIRAGLPRDTTTGAMVESICLSTTFAQDHAGVPVGPYVYGRSSNPNRESFEKAVAELESAKYALAFSSGMTATAAVLQGLGTDSRVVAMGSLYGGTHRYLTHLAPAFGVKVSFNLGKKISIVWIETPSNPTLSLVDIRAVADAAHAEGCILVVDNTLLSPYFQNPLSFGADIVLHSVTKYINGHTDVLMGVVALNCRDTKKTLSFIQNAAGSVPSPFDCWLAHRGLKTLHLHAPAAARSALAIANLLEESPLVLSVNYPGLDSHLQRAIAVKQHRDGLGGAMVSFRIRGGPDAAAKFCENSKLFTLAESLGGLESLCEIPAVMTHSAMPINTREAGGIHDDMIRLSVGLEDTDDLVNDILETLEVTASRS
ncbi:unnamed protein product [Penicillium salamii]|uniref:cystathionine gamma-lyase n=1 Tax=Penicillium salamii TaxID=1612424 RepID=A0A9W4NJM8_9EURO|nr:unnamed protein product [Penicillium salamii]CAG8227186.1 unnamed protein product [Penicillium salamii]CAG8374696.1 unnamed protein product [Penicillium salamii]CAG8383512.1 unnamed protein product [Penicillium salamii]CAG8387060.1 unnamed protein product [Penicillium salamii]